MLTRRSFIKSTLGGLTLVSFGGFIPTIFSRAITQAASNRSPSSAGAAPGRTLIVVQLAGGNDGLNTVIPFADGSYRKLRPTLGIPESQMVRLDDRLALHPALAPLADLWDAGHLAIVEGVGYDHPSLSHFQAMDIWQTADPLGARHHGWLSTLVGGSVDADGHPFQALSLGPSLAPALCCPDVPPPALSGLDEYQLQADRRFPNGAAARDQALSRLYASYLPTAPYAALLEATANAATASVQQLHQLAATHQPAVPFPKSPFGQGLQLLSALIAKDTGLRVGYIVLGGFDTHSNQSRTHEILLKGLAEGLDAFTRDLAAHGKADSTVIMTWSEFGRRAAENASGGTDHGTAAPLFVLGSRVTGGLYGEPPDLAHLENGNLRFATDFRSVYATVLHRWLEADAAAILGAKFKPIGFLR